MEHFDDSNSHLERGKREHPTKDCAFLNMSQPTSKDLQNLGVHVEEPRPLDSAAIADLEAAVRGDSYSKDVLASVPPKALDEILGCHWTKRDQKQLEMIRSHFALKDRTRMIVSTIFLCLAEFFTALDLVLVILPKIVVARANAVDESEYPVEVVWGENVRLLTANPDYGVGLLSKTGEGLKRNSVTNWKPATVPANLTLFRKALEEIGLQVGLICVFEVKRSDDPEKPNFERQVPQAVAETIACMEKAGVSTGKWILTDGVRWMFASVHKDLEKKPTYQYLCRSYRPWDTTGEGTTALFKFLAYWLLWKSE
ncbi:hypothetical protein CC2G_000093 [Coprinopsis cinerea AmutBmut pab1-1]|nr:hypothetical protein CC2G_000093 [Coprinopsis cinerea AmutBmut pab1-1]